MLWTELYPFQIQYIKANTADKGLYRQSYGFSSSHVQMWELDHKEGWARKNWCFWTVVLEKILVSPLDRKEINQSILIYQEIGNQPWIFTGRTHAEAEAPIFWLPDAVSYLTGKGLDDGKDWGQEQKGTTEDEMVGWHPWLKGREFEWTPGDGEGQGRLVCTFHGVANSRTRLSNWTELNWLFILKLDN